MLPRLILALFPQRMLVWHLNRLNKKLEILCEENHRIERLMEAIDGGYEYTFGFRNHLRRKLSEFSDEMDTLVEQIDFLERFLYSPSEIE